MLTFDPTERGFFTDAAKSIFGYGAKKHRDEDAAYAESHRAKQEEHQHRIIAEERARREQARKYAEAKLEKARDVEAALHAEIEDAVRELSLNEDKLAEAKANLAKTTADLERLGTEKLELVSTVHVDGMSRDTDGVIPEGRCRDTKGVNGISR